MKVLVYKVNKHRKEDKRTVKFSFERVLFLSFIALFTLLIITQAILLNPSIKTFIPFTQEYEGTALGQEAYLYNGGEICLRLINKENDNMLKVLVNGDIIGTFINNKVTFNVKNGDVVELDGSGTTIYSEVKVAAKSDNITSDILNKGFKVKTGVTKVATVRIE